MALSGSPAFGSPRAGSDAALVAKIKGGKEHPATKAGEDDLNKIVKWSLAM